MDFFRELEAFYRDELFCDVTLVCGNELVQAHKLVLASLSPTLEMLLKGHSDEDTQTTIFLDLDEALGSGLKDAFDRLYAFISSVDSSPESISELRRNPILDSLGLFSETRLIEKVETKLEEDEKQVSTNPKK